MNISSYEFLYNKIKGKYFDNVKQSMGKEEENNFFTKNDLEKDKSDQRKHNIVVFASNSLNSREEIIILTIIYSYFYFC